MKEIKSVLICGLGAIGGYYASRLVEGGKELKILVDESRLKRYTSTPRVINGVEYMFDYVLPEEVAFKPDLIIVSTKSGGFKGAVKNIRNFVSEDTIILSFLNGITSEKLLIAEYGDKVLYSYLLGHTFFRSGNNISHDGHAKIVFGSINNNDVRVEMVKNLFDELKIIYEIPTDIVKSQWQKFCFNCCVNQISAVTGKTFGQIKSSPECVDMMRKICDEITAIAEKEGICDADFFENAMKSLDLMIPEGKTSMLQDIEAGRTPEIDLFGGTVVEMGGKYGIDTPINRMLYDKIYHL